MFCFTLLILIVVFVGIRCRKKESEILDLTDTTTINGICVLFIFLSHSTQYFPLSNGFFDQLYQHVQNIHNQWVVAPFLSFSGYGVMISIINKKEYIHYYPYKRILKTLVNFDIAILLYLVVGIIVGNVYSIPTIIGSFVGMTSIGNSNWYIFAILIMYLFSYIAARITEDYGKQIILLFTGTVIYIVMMKCFGFEERFFSTIMCYPAGAALGLYKDPIINFLKKRKCISIIAMIILIAITYKLRYNPLIMNISSIIFVASIVWFLCFFMIQSRILSFFGKHAFSIFILQRIPGILISEFILKYNINKYILLIIDLIIVIAISVIYDYFLKILDRIILNKCEARN